jgi:hypothetical protein
LAAIGCFDHDDKQGKITVHTVQIVQIIIFRVNKDGLGALLTYFLDILILPLPQTTVYHQGVNVCR